MLVLNFSTPTWLVNYYHFIGVTSFVLNSATICLILTKSTKIDNFRYFLLFFQILCTITDFHLTFLMQPMPLFPLISGFCTGFLAKYLDVWSHFLMAFMISLIVSQVACLGHCFVKKHQTIAKIINRHIVPEKVYISSVTVSVCVPIFCYFVFCAAGMNRSDQLDYVEANFPEYLGGFESLPNFAIYTLNFWFLLLACVCFCGGVFGALLFTMTTLDMFRMLRGAQRKVSAASFRRHQSAVKSLLAQFATSSLCLIPPFFFVIVIIAKPESAQTIVQVLLAIFTLHSTVNAVVLIVTTPPYRNFLLRINMKGKKISPMRGSNPRQPD
ncbi:unnamed protein product [Caenorhabditis sp. 36 PRJEB53466]|nr:unnamed protein product [Caenorhabditis sp. 36 PRJEB53466]